MSWSAAANSKYRSLHPEVIREGRLKRLYKITSADYENMVQNQQGRCAICDSIPKGKLHVDHNHVTGKMRGLLCGSCNRALGLFKDQEPVLFRAQQYLRKHG